VVFIRIAVDARQEERCRQSPFFKKWKSILKKQRSPAEPAKNKKNA
jgi:hypothetical protein